MTFAATGTSSVASPDPDPSNWCEWLQNKPGLLYKSSENPFLQSFQLGGRFQYQASYLDGEDVNGRDFNDTYDEYRRVRIESKTEFLRFFSAKVGINAVLDDRRSGNDLDWGFMSAPPARIPFAIAMRKKGRALRPGRARQG